MKNNGITISIVLMVFVLVGGFYFTLEKISKLRDDVKNFETNVEFKLNGESSSQSYIVSGENSTSTEEESTQIKDNITIPTAILFEAQSSPLLSPQTKITIALEKVIKEKETGIIKVNIKAYTNKAESYSALDAGNLFEILNPSGKNQKPLKVKGNFDSIPPKSFVTGEITFKVSPEQDSIILLIESEDGENYYKFDFNNRKYEETIMG
jgi:hypothetical protein